ncbi:protein of unknown function [Nitrospina watsonii]|uniref:Uncharacterized protein n=1 Tax=Nitrospina watsonii TaxID=1323948 RepID=A0ABM9HFM2_9BACT|nr:protein of unknown function [Nitrospina watsonii]
MIYGFLKTYWSALNSNGAGAPARQILFTTCILICGRINHLLRPMEGCPRKARVVPSAVPLCYYNVLI